MLDYVSLRQTGQRWEFESELALENFFYVHLEQLLGLTPLARQYCVKGQVCDILALDKEKKLIVLELKNTEDRYIVQQLTRYDNVLQEQKPFSEQIDYTQSVHLIAIQPSFHRDNLVDIKYHKLSFKFLQFAVIQEQEKVYFKLEDVIAETRLLKLEVFRQEKDDTDNIPNPPRGLLMFLAFDVDRSQI